MPSTSLQQCSVGALTSAACLAGCTSAIAALHCGLVKPCSAVENMPDEVRLPAPCSRRAGHHRVLPRGRHLAQRGRGAPAQAGAFHPRGRGRGRAARAGRAAPAAPGANQPAAGPSRGSRRQGAAARPRARTAPASGPRMLRGPACRALVLNLAWRTLRCEPRRGPVMLPSRCAWVLAERPWAVTRGLPAGRSTCAESARLPGQLAVPPVQSAGPP